MSERPRKNAGPSAGAVRLASAVRARTVTVLATDLGVTEGALRHWQAGRRKPGPTERARLAAELGIDSEAWDTPSPPTPLPAPPVTAPDGTAGDLSTLAGVDAAIARLLADASNPEWGPKERLAAQREATSLARHRARLAGQYAPSEAALTKSPQWARVRDELLAALEAHPKALADVIAVLERHAAS